MSEKLSEKKIGSYSQIPIKLAWAISIHKSQGQTFEQINIDPRCWKIGQFYTAVSRARLVEGIHFVQQLHAYYVKAFPEKEQEILRDSLVELLWERREKNYNEEKCIGDRKEHES